MCMYNSAHMLIQKLGGIPKFCAVSIHWLFLTRLVLSRSCGEHCMICMEAIGTPIRIVNFP